MGKEQKVRCLNCFERIPVPPKTKRLTCPKCSVEYVIAWRGSQAKIAGTPSKR
jgi:Zn finger protein HypA/HybF involved in hydrogenase expression